MALSTAASSAELSRAGKRFPALPKVPEHEGDPRATHVEEELRFSIKDGDFEASMRENNENYKSVHRAEPVPSGTAKTAEENEASLCRALLRFFEKGDQRIH